MKNLLLSTIVLTLLLNLLPDENFAYGNLEYSSYPVIGEEIDGYTWSSEMQAYFSDDSEDLPKVQVAQFGGQDFFREVTKSMDACKGKGQGACIGKNTVKELSNPATNITGSGSRQEPSKKWCNSNTACGHSNGYARNDAIRKLESQGYTVSKCQDLGVKADWNSHSCTCYSTHTFSCKH